MWAQIEYREFWDVPRLFIVRYKARVYLFNCRFEEALDEYPDKYKVYLFDEDKIASTNWEEEITADTPYLGEIEIKNVKFDVTRRKEMDVGSFALFTERSGQG